LFHMWDLIFVILFHLCRKSYFWSQFDRVFLSCKYWEENAELCLYLLFLIECWYGVNSVFSALSLFQLHSDFHVHLTFGCLVALNITKWMKCCELLITMSDSTSVAVALYYFEYVWFFLLSLFIPVIFILKYKYKVTKITILLVNKYVHFISAC
jgi:hypothetical protein